MQWNNNLKVLFAYYTDKSFFDVIT